MNFELVEKYRKTHPLLGNTNRGDNYGWFEIPAGPFNRILNCLVAPSTDEWQHVSVSLKERPNRCPHWLEMCFVKNLFWGEDEIVVQFHPKKAEYVNMHSGCLHLWAWTQGEFPHPPKELVGV